MLSMAPPVEHASVLVKELLTGLRVAPGGVHIDCCLGPGGHAEAVLDASAPGGRLLGIDLDPEAVSIAGRNLKRFASSAVLINDTFADLGAIAARHGFANVDGIYFDLGLSSLQLAAEGRGFSFKRDDPLDMRFDPAKERTAAELINSGTAEEIAQVLRNFGEEPRSRAIARRIVKERPIETTGQLAHLVQRVTSGHRHKIHPATRTFQALRMWVNEETSNLQRALPQALALLKPGGRLGIISFHSLDDRAVKTLFQQEARDCICPPEVPVCVCGHHASIGIITRKVIVPTEEETDRNPRSRSAKLRIAQKL